ncbi:MAG: DNA polymerase I [Phocaeicola vulgatus]|nr:DNA polymerase I [Phocaeicola vulgatus]
MEEKKLVLLDAYALIFRAYYALIRNPRYTSQGLNTSAIFGFVNTLQDLLKRENPSHIAICFDPKGGTFRHEMYAEYKAGREETPEDIRKAVPYIKRIAQAYNIAVLEVPGYEADDVIGTLSLLAEKKGFTTYMVTGDKDFGQLVSQSVKIYRPNSGGGYEIMGEKEVCDKFGIERADQVIDMLALMGDKVDNIPGCPGVGEVTAAKLIRQFGSVENLINNTSELKGALKKKVEENIEKIKFSKFLATICREVPIELNEQELKRQPINAEALRQLFKELEFRNFATRIIDQNEGNIGLDGAPAPEVKASATSAAASAPTAAKTAQVKKKQSAQMSLFGDDDEEEENTENIPTETPVIEQPVEIVYTHITDADELKRRVADAMKLDAVGCELVADGDDAMTASLVGIAVAVKRGSAFYADASLVELLKPLLESASVTLVSGDVKRAMVVLRRRGINLAAPYFDTAVAHYLLQPERPHATARLAEEILGVACTTDEALLGAKGRNRKRFVEVSGDAITAYACQLADMALALRKPLIASIDADSLTSLLTDIELPLIEVLADMEHTGARVDVRALTDYSVVLTERMNSLEQECFELAGEQFNTASPMKVGEILFDKLKIDDKAKKTKSGQYSTTEEVLMHLRDRHPLVDKILELRGIRKLLSTYVNALPELINPETGRIHTTYNQTVTATGRLSSTNPNLQNIPVRTDDGREIRRAFIPADGNLFFSADYSQIELRLVADLSGDPTMVDAFRNNLDIHAITAAKIYHEPLEKVTPDQRRKAKTANFGILYGISAFGLSERLQIPRAESKMLIDGYFATFPGVRDYIERSVTQAKEKGYVTTLFGRRRMLPDINSRNAVVRSFSERNAVNAPIQGTAADIIKIAMVSIFNKMKQEGLRSKMILQVHDELNFDVVPAEAERVQQIAVECMQNAYHGNVPLTASHAIATNWLDAH